MYLGRQMMEALQYSLPCLDSSSGDGHCAAKQIEVLREGRRRISGIGKQLSLLCLPL